MTSEAVRAFREDYRREHVPPHYKGWLHLAFAWRAMQVEQVRPVEWLTPSSQN